MSRRGVPLRAAGVAGRPVDNRRNHLHPEATRLNGATAAAGRRHAESPKGRGGAGPLLNCVRPQADSAFGTTRLPDLTPLCAWCGGRERDPVAKATPMTGRTSTQLPLHCQLRSNTFLEASFFFSSWFAARRDRIGRWRSPKLASLMRRAPFASFFARERARATLLSFGGAASATHSGGRGRRPVDGFGAP